MARRPVEDQPTDRELIARVLAGEHDAYEVLVSRYADFVYTVVLRVVRNETEADDVAQETFIRAFKALGRFRGDSKFSSWLYRIAVNRALTHVKRGRRREAVADLASDAYVETETLVSRPEAPDRRVIEGEFHERVRAAVGTLPPRYRAVVTLFYLEEKSYKEVAEIMGIPMGTLKTHLHRARAMLREALAEFEPETGRGE